MSQPPELIPFNGDWSSYEDAIYEAFLTSFVRADVRFRGLRAKAQFRPETRGKGFSFWHVISESAHPNNRNEEDRIPDLRRCERIRWIAWVIERASAGADGFSWWKNKRKGDLRLVIWAEAHDFVVVLAKRRDYYVLKTAFCELKPHRRKSFSQERDAFRERQKG